jgi:hypothetical protein
VVKSPPYGHFPGHPQVDDVDKPYKPPGKVFPPPSHSKKFVLLLKVSQKEKTGIWSMIFEIREEIPQS